MTALELPTPDPRSLDETVRPFAEAIAERYAIKRLIGTGGMGMVYLARDRRLDRLVAIKTLPAHLATDGVVRERFLRETRTAGGMAHPNIVAIHGADEVAGHVFFVMTYVRGTSLATRIRANGRLDATSVLAYMHDVASGLAHAHARGIVHRDIKAENILIDQDTNRALVTDFGIARLAEASPLTVTGQVLGSVHYVSPEQVSGEVVDARTDIYSLGVVGYVALTGVFPFDAELASAVMLQHVIRAAAPIASVQRDVPAALAAIIDRCLSKSPAHRYASADELLEALEAARHARAEQPPRISDAEAQLVWKRAAELQAATGIQPRPTIVPRLRDPSADVARTSGIDLDAVREAAAGAGIPVDYVDHALGERGLGERGWPRPNAVADGALDSARAAGRSWWARAPLQTVHELEVDGTLQPSDLQGLVHLLREETESVGQTMAGTRELAWQSGSAGARLTVSVVPHDTSTSIRVVRDLRRAVYTRTAVAMAASVPVLMLAIATALEIAPDWEGTAILSGFAVAGLFAWQVGRRLIGRAHESAQRRVRHVAHQLAGAVATSEVPPNSNAGRATRL